MVIYDSVFGNTEQVARAIADALGSQGEVETRRVGEVKPERLTQLALLVVGSPTRAFRPTPAVSKFLAGLPGQALTGVKVAAFDTRIDLSDIDSTALRTFVRLFGYAAGPIAKRLAKKGGQPVVPPEGFFVAGTEGPLKEGELKRAADWARQILAKL